MPAVSRVAVRSSSPSVRVTEWRPRTAYPSATGPSAHGARSPAPAWATSSSFSPSGSSSAIASSSKRRRGSSATIPSPSSRRRHQPSDPAGTEKAVTVAWPVPRLPRRANGQGKKVSRLPGRPLSSP